MRYKVKGGRRTQMGDFQKLKVWQKAKGLAVFIYRITEQGSFAKDYGLKDQIRRSAVSISSNIAEGDEMGSNRQAVKFFPIAKGSAAELFTQPIIAYEIGHLKQDHFDHVKNGCQAISGMLTKLIQARLRNI
jgi:four helix bundle protein